jgi:hypothetical protein
MKRPIGGCDKKEHTMNTIHTRGKVLTAAVIAAAALIPSAGSAQAFNPQPDPPGFPAHPGDSVENTWAGIIDPGSTVGTVMPGASGLPGHEHGEDGPYIAEAHFVRR